jgi:hypothetical protein
VHEDGSGRRRRRLAKTLSATLGLALTGSMLVAAPAQALTDTVTETVDTVVGYLTPKILGVGAITGPGSYTCTNNDPSLTTVLACDPVEHMLLTDTVLEAAAGAGYVFGSWQNCARPSGTTCTTPAGEVTGLLSEPTAVFTAVAADGGGGSAPLTSLFSYPPAETAETNAAFAFVSDTGSEDGFECTLTGPAGSHGWRTCVSPTEYAGLTPGDYSFAVRAVSDSVEGTPASHVWTVLEATANDSLDNEPPETRVKGGGVRRGWLLRKGTRFRLTSSEESSTYNCGLNGRSLDTCGETVRLRRLAQRTHRFSATAVDAAGNEDQTAANRFFTVPKNNTKLKHSAGWKKRKAKGHYLNSFSQTKKRGAVLRTKVRGVKRVALVASQGRGHGTVKVFLGKKLLKKVSLQKRRNVHKRIVPVANFDKRKRGVIRVKVISRGKPVRIEGVGIARR